MPEYMPWYLTCPWTESFSRHPAWQFLGLYIRRGGVRLSGRHLYIYSLQVVLISTHTHEKFQWQAGTSLSFLAMKWRHADQAWGSTGPKRLSSPRADLLDERNITQEKVLCVKSTIWTLAKNFGRKSLNICLSSSLSTYYYVPTLLINYWHAAENKLTKSLTLPSK